MSCFLIPETNSSLHSKMDDPEDEVPLGKKAYLPRANC